MPVLPLAQLVNPAHSVVVTMECQRGVCGDLADFSELAAAAEAAGVTTRGPRLVMAAHSAGVRVLHATALRRRDGAGSVTNCRILGAAAEGVVEGTPGAELMPGFGPAPEDIVVPRLSGVSPFTSTALDQTIRNLGATTVIVIGVSLNVGVLGLVVSGVDLGYQVVVATDAVAGVPLDYGREVLEGTISVLATLATVDEIVASWVSAAT